MSKNQSIDVGAQPDRFIIGFMITAHLLAIIGLFHFTWHAFAAFLIFYAITVLGITLGFHRLFTHRAFKAPKWLEYTLAVMGTMALQGGVNRWVAHHRMHHAGSDTPKDPHSAARGFWYSHLLWMLYYKPQFDDQKILRRFSRDIMADPVLVFLSKWPIQIGMQVGLGFLLLWFGGVEMMLWGVFVRLVAVYHVTWFVNSASHIWGYKNYKTDDLATNCWWVGLLAFGEGWHNNHHAYPHVAPAGHKWWEFDLTWQVLKALRYFGWATDVKLPPAMSQADEGMPAAVPVSLAKS